MRLLRVGMIAASVWAIFASNGFAAEIATALDVDPSAIVRVSGSSHAIVSGRRVSQGDVIQTGATGQVQLLFDDQTRVVVGPNSRLVIDSVLMKSKTSASRFTVTAVKGSFRFITGHSSKSAYQIKTPTATMGVRGTVFDFAINGARETDLAVLNGRVRFCGRSGQCKEIPGGCSLIFANRRGGLQVPRTLEEGAKRVATGFPYLFSQRTLLQKFRAGIGGCSRYTRLTRPGSKPPNGIQRINTPAPTPAPTPPEAGTPENPDTPETPDTPDSSGNPGNSGNTPGAGNTAGNGSDNSRDSPGNSGDAPGQNK